MSTYLFHLVHTPEALAKLLAEPEDRFAANEPIFKAAGGSLVGFWYGVGGSDVYVVGELPDDLVATTLVARVTASGAFSSVSTTRLLTTKEMVTALRGQVASDYRPIGQAG